MAAAIAAPLSSRRFTVDDVMKMLDAGVVTEDERVELIDGELVLMSPQGPTHCWTIRHLGPRLFQAHLAPHFEFAEQGPAQIQDSGLPEPDIVIFTAAPTAMPDVIRAPTRPSWSSRRRHPA